MPITNAEKQARFRKKEELQKFAGTTFREWQAMAMHRRATPQEVMALLQEAATLPAGWTDEDYERAEHRIGQLRLDLITSQDEVQNDVHAARNPEQEFLKAPDPGKWISETNEAVASARALASHLISALELSGLGNAERAAATMEAMRHVGRALANSQEVAKSNATTLCLAALPGYYDRPDWFVDSLTTWLAWQLDKELTRKLGNRLIEYDYGDWP